MLNAKTPWKVQEGGYDSIIDADGEYITDNQMWENSAPSLEDMHTIVRAVNSHDQLVAALKDAIFYADSIVERGIWGEADAKRFRDVLNAAAGEQS